MPLVFAGACSHAPGITGRAERADSKVRDEFYAAFDRMRQAIEDARADALVVVGAEHFANFFMDNMPAYCVGMGDYYEGPIEDPDWLGIQPVKAPGNPDLSKRLIKLLLNDIDVAYAEEWKFDHGIIVPLMIVQIAISFTAGDTHRKTNPVGVHIYRGNAYKASGTYTKLSELPPVRDGKYIRATVDTIRDYPLEWLMLMGQKIKYFFSYFEFPNNDYYDLDRLLYVPLQWLPSYGVLLFLAAAGFLFFIRGNDMIQYLGLLGVSYALGVVVFFTVLPQYNRPNKQTGEGEAQCTQQWRG